MATVLVFGDNSERETRKKEFGTHWNDLQRLGRWLRACRVERVAHGIHRRVLETGLECAGTVFAHGVGPSLPGEKHPVS
jgi:hypothetical protein